LLASDPKPRHNGALVKRESRASALIYRAAKPPGEKLLRIPIHREGWRFIAVAAIINAALLWLYLPVGLACLPFSIWCVVFFRDPERATPQGRGLVVSPADGRLLPIISALPPSELGMGDTPRLRLSIFMDVFNVHVNRVPVDGRVIALNYKQGRFFNASFDKASVDNERMAIRIDPKESQDGGGVAVIQIAGLVARRIKCDLARGQEVRRGERFGIIRFGSRLDVYLPPGSAVTVVEGARVKAGETVLATLPQPGDLRVPHDREAAVGF
jgi:phosphatidylserine decarboxylase